MFYLNGFEEIISKTLSLAMNVNEKIDSLADLKESYIEFLKKLQPQVIFNRDESVENFSLNKTYFSLNLEEVKALASCFSHDSILSDKKANIDDVDLKIVTIVKKRYERSLEMLKEKNSDLYEIFKLLINTSFYARSSTQGGGSSSSAVSVLWCSFKQHWSDYDILEFLIHELTHTCVFLDELVYGHYISFEKIADEKNFAYSSVLRCKRPMDKVVHSLIVANEILSLRQNFSKINEEFNAHPNSKQLLESMKQTIKSIEEVQKREKVLKPRVEKIIREISRSIGEYEKFIF